MVLKLVIFPFLMHQALAFPFLPYSNPYFHYSTDASEASTQLKVGVIGVICFLMELLLLLICGCFRKKTPKMVAKEESEGETFKSLMFRTNFKASGKGYGTMTLHRSSTKLSSKTEKSDFSQEAVSSDNFSMTLLDDDNLLCGQRSTKLLIPCDFGLNDDLTPL